MPAAGRGAGVPAQPLHPGPDGSLTRQVFVLSGAGLSAESGIPTFRDPQSGLWARYDPMQLATPEAFAADPDLVHRFYSDRRAAARQVQPNAAHAALARLQAGLRAAGGEAVLCTQNVDDLLERAGALEVVHMHGSLFDGSCQACGTVSGWDGPMGRASVCPACGAVGAMRPGVVWFGEVPHHLERIAAAIEGSELFVAVGTSGAVYPAAGFVDAARRAGIRTLEINLAESARTAVFDATLVGAATEQVPRWADELLSAWG